MAWNTHHIQRQMDLKPDAFADKLMARVAPLAHAHINMRGIISFNLSKAEQGLISSTNRVIGHSNLSKAE